MGFRHVFKAQNRNARGSKKLSTGRNMNLESKYHEFVCCDPIMAFFMSRALAKDRVRHNTVSFLVKGKTAWGATRDYHLHKVLAEASNEILTNYAQYLADKFPDRFTGFWQVQPALSAGLLPNTTRQRELPRYLQLSPPSKAH